MIGMFCYNSLGVYFAGQVTLFILGTTVFSILSALWFRGRLWNYFVVVIIVAVCAVVMAFLFPMIELLLDAILNEKMKKVGEKIRLQHKMLREHYAKNSTEAGS